MVEILRQIDAGVLTAEAAIARSRAAIAEQDPAVRAFVRVDAAAAPGAGSWAGIAVGVKDIIDTSDMPTEMGSPIYAGWRPKADAAVVVQLKRLGATIIGKTATTAFASMDPTETRNPRCAAVHTPGGSSSGSAAAVAAGMTPLALGTQTGGSVIRPASFCGVCAIKPSFGLLPMTGIKTFAWSLDTLGLFTAAVEDAAAALAALTDRPELTISLGAYDGRAPRIGIVIDDVAGQPEAEGAAALRAAIHAAERAGAKACDVAMPEVFAEAWRSHGVLQSYEAARALAWELANRRDALAPRVRAELETGRTVTAATYDTARGNAKRARAGANAVFADIDVLMCLSAPGPAPASLATTGDPRFNRLWTQLGVPCVNVPAYLAGNGLPIGVQVIAPFGSDDVALAAARFLERALDDTPAAALRKMSA